MEYDFGVLKEVEGPKQYRFNFENAGNKPLIINHVEVHCGCTTADWIKSPIMPGKKGYIEVTYDPKNSSPTFNKQLNVISNVSDPVILKVMGEVILNTNYKKTIGNLSLETDQIEFGKILNTETKTGEIAIVNRSSQILNISFDKVPAHITARAEPATLDLNQDGKIILTYNAAKANDWSYTQDMLNVLVNGKKYSENTIYAIANIYEDFSKLTPAQKSSAPKIVMAETMYDFGSVKKGENIEYSFELKNTGKSNLIIRKTEARKGLDVINVSSTTIAPGKSATIKVRFVTDNREGKQIKTLNVITNDPENPITRLKITGRIE